VSLIFQRCVLLPSSGSYIYIGFGVKRAIWQLFLVLWRNWPRLGISFHLYRSGSVRLTTHTYINCHPPYSLGPWRCRQHCPHQRDAQTQEQNQVKNETLWKLRINNFFFSSVQNLSTLCIFPSYWYYLMFLCFFSSIFINRSLLTEVI
jgi:hypothetical protein